MCGSPLFKLDGNMVRKKNGATGPPKDGIFTYFYWAL